MFSVKVHKSMGETVVACCDKSILGMKLSDEGLEIDISEDFYGGEEACPKRLAELLEGASCANLMGDATCELAIEKGLIAKENVLSICGIKHAQIFSI